MECRYTVCTSTSVYKASNSETPIGFLKVEVHQTNPPTRICAVSQLELCVQRQSPKKVASNKNSPPVWVSGCSTAFLQVKKLTISVAEDRNLAYARTVCTRLSSHERELGNEDRGMYNIVGRA